VTTGTAPRRTFDTARRDRWWLPPLATGLGLAAFGVYAFVAAALGDDYRYTEGGAEYLSPLYSPDLAGWGLDVPFSSAFLVLWVPLGFRATCYYYRKAYYRAFFLSPPACAVVPRKGRYRGEASLPFVLMNAHRYFLFLATVVLGFIWYDAVRAFIFDGAFGVGVGSLVLLTNVVLIAGYTLGCHSFRHLVGGVLDTLSRSPARKKTYDCVSCLNRHHPKWAWFSLVFVGFTDVYVRLCSMGVIRDLRII
jgi:hypothetical protein